ncbi:MAG: DUF3429 domain-containing protein [Xanthomonadales bacterium]|nr:DUF3429 domain-containing protein [Gammaproteobacteria bacterium]NNL05324.1 DUF3429 domain-containing protein [Xanthomonadales bacterium]
MTIKQQHHIPGGARLLGYLGVVPFAGMSLAALLWHEPTVSWMVRGFTVYAAIILSFLGGIRWGVETRFHPSSVGALTVSVLPSLWAFGCLLLTDPVHIVLGMTTGFVAMGLVDWSAPARGSAPWMRSLRAQLTLAVVYCHGLMLVALAKG